MKNDIINLSKLENQGGEIAELAKGIREEFVKKQKENLKLPPRDEASATHKSLCSLIKEATKLKFELECEYGLKE